MSERKSREEWVGGIEMCMCGWAGGWVLEKEMYQHEQVFASECSIEIVHNELFLYITNPSTHSRE